MDINITKRAGVTLRNKTTGQENHFDDQAAADNFLGNVDGPKDWTQDAEATDVDAAPAGDEPAAEPAPTKKSAKK